MILILSISPYKEVGDMDNKWFYYFETIPWNVMSNSSNIFFCGSVSDERISNTGELLLEIVSFPKSK